MTLQLPLPDASRVTRVVVLIGFVLAIGAQGQTPKIDSLLLHLRLPRDRAADAVVAAFTQAGLGITNTTTSLVEADLGTTQSLNIKTRRIVRAVLFGSDSMTTLLMTGDEVRTEADGTLLRRLRIDNHAGGNGGKAWKKMVTAARILDSASVPAAATPDE